jgi:hypothetical protein
MPEAGNTPRLIRLFAYPVSPGVPPDVQAGGAKQASAGVRQALAKAQANSKLEKGLPVSLILDTTTRSSDVRSSLLQIAFATRVRAEVASRNAAGRLAGAMHWRSKPCLLVVSVYGSSGSSPRKVVLWLFPQDSVFRLSPQAMQVHDDAYSQSSSLRKAACFEGAHDNTGFLGGRVVDREANSTDRYAADFWVNKFLAAQLQIGTEEGTQIFAGTLRKANEKLQDPEARTSLHSAG